MKLNLEINVPSATCTCLDRWAVRAWALVLRHGSGVLPMQSMKNVVRKYVAWNSDGALVRQPSLREIASVIRRDR
jgi:hypothetical protein